MICLTNARREWFVRVIANAGIEKGWSDILLVRYSCTKKAVWGTAYRKVLEMMAECEVEKWIMEADIIDREKLRLNNSIYTYYKLYGGKSNCNLKDIVWCKLWYSTQKFPFQINIIKSGIVDRVCVFNESLVKQQSNEAAFFLYVWKAL